MSITVRVHIHRHLPTTLNLHEHTLRPALCATCNHPYTTQVIRNKDLVNKLKSLGSISPYSASATLGSVHSMQLVLRSLGLDPWAAAIAGIDVLPLDSISPFIAPHNSIFYPTNIELPVTLPLEANFNDIPHR